MNAPKLVTGDGALGAWAALRDVFPAPGATLLGPQDSERTRHAPQAAAAQREEPAARDGRGAHPRGRPQGAGAVPRRVRREVPEGGREARQRLDALTAFYDFPAEHWRHLRTTNPIESSFATVKLRTKVTKGAGSKKAALAMAYKLLDAAQERWRRFNGHELVADVLDGVKFKDGIKVTDDETTTDERVAA